VLTKREQQISLELINFRAFMYRKINTFAQVLFRPKIVRVQMHKGKACKYFVTNNQLLKKIFITLVWTVIFKA
jgi:hypothetical protein